jgi:hypothetical protein
MNRSKGTLKRQRELISALRRDPGHLPELVVLHAQRSLSSGAAEWAVRAEGSESESATRAARAALRGDFVSGASVPVADSSAGAMNAALEGDLEKQKGSSSD